jgi:hypothetical protein
VLERLREHGLRIAIDDSAPGRSFDALSVWLADETARRSEHAAQRVAPTGGVLSAKNAPVAQRIERRPSKPRAEVRFLPGAPRRNARGSGPNHPQSSGSTRRCATAPLFDLPLGAIASHDPPTALPQRTLLRHLTWKLPSGQRVAQAIGATVLSSQELSELRSFGVGFERSTPLWYYVLKEAELMEQGLKLGPVGGRVVAEVLIGLLQSDPASFLAAQPGWQPTLQNPGAGFRMTDFLRFARVDPASRGQ